jgi:hypothetical protein
MILACYNFPTSPGSRGKSRAPQSQDPHNVPAPERHFPPDPDHPAEWNAISDLLRQGCRLLLCLGAETTSKCFSGPYGSVRCTADFGDRLNAGISGCIFTLRC